MKMQEMKKEKISRNFNKEYSNKHTVKILFF